MALVKPIVAIIDMSIPMLLGVRCRLARILVASAAVALSSASAQMQIGSLNAGGGLSKELSIAHSTLGPISLSHQTDPKGRGTYSIVSEWKVPALFTFAGPDGRKDTVWVRPGGQAERFRNKDIEKRKPDDLIEDWTAVSEGGQGNYTFHGRDGSIYLYEMGQLRELTLPDGREFRIDTDGPRITQIRQRFGEVALLEAKYDDAGQLIQLVVGQIEHRFKYDREPGLLSLTAYNKSEELLRGIAHEWNDRGQLVGRTILTEDEAQTDDGNSALN